jgi:hypothetical protein
MTDEMSKALQKVETAEPSLPVVAGFGSKDGFDLLLRQAKWLAESDLLPKQFRKNVPNTVVGLEMANRMGASPLAVFQNIYVVHGKPGWSAQFTIAAVNSTGKFSPLRFQLTDLGPEQTVTVTLTEYEEGKKQTRNITEKIRDRICIAWAIEKETGERLESPPVSMVMSVMEGWYSKAGSKWKTMPELMLRYRAAAFFGRLYAPEVLMGMKTIEEIEDIVDLEPSEYQTIPEKTASKKEALKEKLKAKKDAPPEASPVEQATPPVEDPIPDAAKYIWCEDESKRVTPMRETCKNCQTQCGEYMEWLQTQAAA